MLSRLVVLLLLAQGARAGCDCNPLQQPPPGYRADQWPQFYIQNPINDSGNVCTGTCTYTMDSGNPNNGVGNFNILHWDQDDNGNSISILGQDSKGGYTVSTPVNGMTYNNRPTSPVNFQSLSQKVQVTVTMGPKPVNILATLERTNLGTVAPTAGTTPIPVPTTPYAGPYKKDPALISNDVIFMVDAGLNNGIQFNNQTFTESKELAAKIVSALTNVYPGNATNAPATGSRLGISILSQIASGSVTQPWLESASTVAGLLRGLTPVLAQTQYVDSIRPLLRLNNSPFSINNDAPQQNSRPQAQRLLIVVSSTLPSDITSMPSLDFQSLDVHPIFIAYKFNTNDKTTALDSLRNWTVHAVDDNSDQTVGDFVNNYLLIADNVCPIDSSDDLPVPPADAGNIVFKYPSNYGGATSAVRKWTITGQSQRYCNFHKVSRTIKASDNNNCYTVYYDLEVEKDFLRFYDSNNNEIASFTGRDISGSKFTAKGNISFNFKTNESQVFGGFQIEYTAGACQ